MNDTIVNRIFRMGAFVVLAAVIVLLFPRYNNSFRYHFEVGKPWGYATLTADFDFPIYKTDAQMQEEQRKLLTTFTPYYRYVPQVQREVMVVSLAEMDWLQTEGFNRVAIMQRGGVYKPCMVSELYTPASAYKRFGYDCALNLVRDTAFTQSQREKLLSTLSPTHGLVQKGEKIIGKGEIVTDRATGKGRSPCSARRCWCRFSCACLLSISTSSGSSICAIPTLCFSSVCSC